MDVTIKNMESVVIPESVNNMLYFITSFLGKSKGKEKIFEKTYKMYNV